MHYLKFIIIYAVRKHDYCLQRRVCRSNRNSCNHPSVNLYSKQIVWQKNSTCSYLAHTCSWYIYNKNSLRFTNELPRDKTNKMVVRPAKTQISLGICPVWSESSLSAWRNLGSLATQWAHSEDSDQTGWMPRLTWVIAGRTTILLVLSRGGSNSKCKICIYLFLLTQANQFYLSHVMRKPV